MPGAKHLLQLVTPPALWSMAQAFKRQFVSAVDHMEYAPGGWATPLQDENCERFWTSFIGQEREAFEALVARVQGGKPLTTPGSDEKLKYLAFSVAVDLATQDKHQISILDYGGNLGDYLWIARALMPARAVDFHCKELPPIAAVGRIVNPSVTWHVDDSCFDATYDLVMFVSSLQYVREWRDTVRHGAAAARDILLLSDAPMVQTAPSFVATQRSRGRTTLYSVLNRSDVVETVERTGLRFVKEFEMGPHPLVANAPEQPRCLGLLFRR